MLVPDQWHPTLQGICSGAEQKHGDHHHLGQLRRNVSGGRIAMVWELSLGDEVFTRAQHRRRTAAHALMDLWATIGPWPMPQMAAQVAHYMQHAPKTTVVTTATIPTHSSKASSHENASYIIPKYEYAKGAKKSLVIAVLSDTARL